MGDVGSNWGSWGALRSILHQKPAKKEKNRTFLAVFGASWEAFWRPCGLQEAILAASWASWGRFGSLWVDFGSIFELLVAWAAFQKTFKKQDLFGCFWSVLGGILAPMWAPRGHLGCILGVLGSIFGAFGSILGAFFGYLLHGLHFKKH